MNNSSIRLISTGPPIPSGQPQPYAFIKAFPTSVSQDMGGKYNDRNTVTLTAGGPNSSEYGPPQTAVLIPANNSFHPKQTVLISAASNGGSSNQIVLDDNIIKYVNESGETINVKNAGNAEVLKIPSHEPIITSSSFVSYKAPLSATAIQGLLRQAEERTELVTSSTSFSHSAIISQPLSQPGVGLQTISQPGVRLQQINKPEVRLQPLSQSSVGLQSMSQPGGGFQPVKSTATNVYHLNQLEKGTQAISQSELNSQQEGNSNNHVGTQANSNNSQKLRMKPPNLPPMPSTPSTPKGTSADPPQSPMDVSSPFLDEEVFLPDSAAEKHGNKEGKLTSTP